MPLQILTGFAVWCTWCIGHDAGHGTVAKPNSSMGKAINRIVGEITHSMVCLVFYGHMWEGHSVKEKADATLSVAVSVATAGTYGIRRLFRSMHGSMGCNVLLALHGNLPPTPLRRRKALHQRHLYL
mmetsp:Transcript_16828/g.36332  ORF Transcript_16828/g.36332 Transcript_16828/m.36332 type:complete len:127 (-) Transcript_16828:404-784(-)